MADTGALYAEGRTRVGDLVRSLEDAQTAAVVPPCPEWTVKDVLSHMSGVCVDILEGRLDGIATEPWTARQVDERRGWTVARIVDEWNEAAPKVEAIAQQFPNGADVQWLADMTTHEHDIRCAIGRPGARDSAAVALALPWLVRALGRDGLAAGGDAAGDAGGVFPAFRVVTPEGDNDVMGTGEPVSTVRAPRFELFRALTGRRSEDQIATFDWDGDYRRHIGGFSRGPFRMAGAPISE